MHADIVMDTFLFSWSKSPQGTLTMTVISLKIFVYKVGLA